MKTVDIVERIEGEAKLICSWDKNIIDDARIEFLNFRGFEFMLQGKSPLDALIYTPRICGICGQAHLKTTVEALENIYKNIGEELVITNKAKLLREIGLNIEIIDSHIKWFYMFIMPDIVSLSKDNYKKRIRIFNFDYENKKILVSDRTIGKEKIHTALLEEKFISIDKESSSDLNYFAKNDILSLFFNLKNKIKTYKSGEEYVLKAVGANKTKGLINILIPSNESFKKLDKILKTDDKSKFTVFINQKIFQSEKGELLISLNKEGFCSFAILKDVLFFGDIVGKMTNFKINEGKDKI